MRICPNCRRGPSDPGLLKCEHCNVFLVEASDPPPNLSEDDLARIAQILIKSFKKDDWHQLGKEFARSINLIHDAKQLAYALLQIPVFHFVLWPLIICAFLVLWGYGGHVAKQKVESMFNATVTNLIRQELSTTNIHAIMADVASNRASNLMQQAIQPEILKFELTLSAKLETVHALEQTHFTQLQTDTELYSTMLRAQALEQSAFWQLVKISDQEDHPYRTVAKNMVNQITDGLMSQVRVLELFTTAPNVWEGTTNTDSTASLQAYTKRLFQTGITRNDLWHMLGAFYNQTRFPLHDRLKLLAAVIEQWDDLLIVDRACALMGKEAHMTKNFMAAPEYLAWYKQWLKDNPDPTQ